MPGSFPKAKNYDSALLYSNEADGIFKNINYAVGRGYCLGNIGIIYTETGKYDLAEANWQMRSR
jgi:hypothetical protein